MMLTPLAEGPLSLVWNHFMPDAQLDDLVWILRQLFRRLISMTTQLHARLILPFQCWPYKLVTMVDSSQERFEELSKRTFDDFMSAPVCCLDESPSTSATSCASTSQHAVSTCKAADYVNFLELYLPTLDQWSQQTELSNFSIERLLSRCKRSVPETCPNLERFLCTSYLSEWLSEHIRAGGQDPRKSIHKKELAKQGVSLPGTKKRRTTRTQGANGLCSYIRDHMPATAHTAAARNQERRRFQKQQPQGPSNTQPSLRRLATPGDPSVGICVYEYD